MNSEYLVVSDLDGTLLDHHTYDWSEASQALALLRSRNIPLVLCSSKTAAEIASVRDALENTDPFIVENGGAIYLPAGEDDEQPMQVIEFGMNRADVLMILEKIRDSEHYDYIGFSDMSVAQLIAATGLDEARAINALQRGYTEPLLWQDSEENLERFLRRLDRAGLDGVRGGRFLHVSAGCDKGKAVSKLREYYQHDNGAACCLIALGDSDNDLSMLEKADIAVLVRSPVKPFPVLGHEHCYQTSGFGPCGWNEALLKILNKEERG